MPIKFKKADKMFILTTKNTAYAFSVECDRYLVHQYYGKKTAAFKRYEPYVVSFSPYLKEAGNSWSPDIFPQEYSFFGSGDFRTAALKLKGADGTGVTDFVYRSYRYINGTHEIEGLPQARGDEDTKTLEIRMADALTGCELFLYYTVFYEEDVITRHILLKNKGKSAVKIEKCMSMTLDLPSCRYDLITLWGGHVDERNYQRAPLHHGVQSICSRRGASSHQYNPFMAVCDKKATEEKGDVYGFNLVYSGSFLDEAEVDQTEKTRVQLGLGEENFGYTLLPGEEFTSPEAVMTYSSKGLGQMSRNFHAFTRNRIMPKKALKPHPVVLNTWEACYFNIDEEKLLRFAEESAKVGFDMLVMDDGWFGARNHDRAGLGDWYVNTNKFKNGLAPFVKGVKQNGISFGIWIEPEMINPDSDLYRAHPEWVLAVPGREPSLSREQLVLDMSNPEVVDYLIDSFTKTFEGVPVDYFKWDANRHLCDIYSPTLPADRQDEVPFRFMKGVYRLFKWFEEHFPDTVIETCAGGGGRYDLGMMQYGFQIWTSDNTWPYARVWMQRSSLLAYPAATMSCHVSNPGEDMKSLDYRYKVAVGGMLGYELNILNMTAPIKEEMARQVKEYKSFEHLVRLGDYYCIACPFLSDYSSYYYTNEDRSEILFSLIEKRSAKKGVTKPLKIKEAKKGVTYVDVLSGSKYTGEELKAGLVLPLAGEKDTASLMYFVEEKHK